MTTSQNRRRRIPLSKTLNVPQLRGRAYEYARERRPDVAFCDGGLVGQNGQAKVGVSGFCFGYFTDANWRSTPEAEVELTEPELHTFTSEWLLTSCSPSDTGCLDRVTNNQSEFFAAMNLMANLPDDWGGLIVTDSSTTRDRISVARLRRTITTNMDGLPYGWRLHMLEEMERVGSVHLLLVDGHQVNSPFWFHRGNCHVDKACSEASKRIKAWSQEWKAEEETS